jgi:hypothetical protein
MSTEGMAQWQLAELAAKVGALLGLPLDLSWSGHGVRIGAEGDGLYLSEPSNQRGRIQISGWFPHTRYWFDGQRKHITVRADRGPRVIAAEITSRLLPGYRAAMVKVREHDADEQAAQQNRDTLIAYIAALFPPGVPCRPSHCQDHYRSEVLIRYPGLHGGAVKFSGHASEVEFDRFRVPAAVALRMLETVALLVPTQVKQSPEQEAKAA